MKIPKIKKALAICNTPRILPALVIMHCLRRKEIDKDIDRGIAHWHYESSKTMAFLYLMTFDKWFRNLFYYR